MRSEISFGENWKNKVHQWLKRRK